MRKFATLAPTAIVILLISGCGRDDTPEVTAALREVLAGTPIASVDSGVWTDVREFYNRREGAPAWVEDDDLMGAEEAVAILRTAKDHGLDAANYGELQIGRLLDAHASEEGLGKDDMERVKLLGELDARLTTALLALGRDVALGRTSPAALDRRWKARRAAPDFVGTLTTAYGSDLKTWVDSIRPRHPEYAALQKALADQHAQAGQANADPAVSSRIAQLEMNLERWRWMPDEFGSRYILINIPSFHLLARENGEATLDMKVVVGTPEHNTPIFSGDMATVVFSPYWNVPDSIVEGETAPAAARDPNFLARNNIEILRSTRSGVATVDPSTVDWDNPDELKQLAFRQRPGAKNALGHVKFLFPNPYDVYLHDTPADALFARAGRAFSHGCVRVEQPEALAHWVLKDSPEWDDKRILTAMHAGVEKHVKLKQTIPVHILYFTAWPDGAGGVRFEKDVYGYDAKQAAAR